MKRFYLKLYGGWILLLLVVFESSGQQAKVQLTNPVSPTTAGLFKSTERPVGNYTGTIPVNYPIFEVASGQLTVPVNLNYISTGGIRVEELATNVGLGFSLSAGGRITRIQNGGISDDLPTYGYLNNSIKPSNFNSANLSHLLSFQAKQIDLEPDIFLYNFNGESGKFYFNESGQAVMMYESKIKVQYTTDGSGISGWTLTDGKGNKYYFNLKETTTNSYTSPNGNPPTISYVSSWVLTEIKDMNDANSIMLNYQANTLSFTSFSGGYKKAQSRWDVYCDNAITEDLVYVTTTINERVLTNIIGNSGSINFISSYDRLDNSTSSKLKSITLNDFNGNLKKTYKFNYDYFLALWGGSSPDDYRLKLKSLSQFGSSGLDSITHKFEYEETFNLPNRLSKAVDFWGFFNGEYNNATYFPNTTSTYYSNRIKYTTLANRHVNPIFAPANALKRIIHPTGGSREFVYEGNIALLQYDDQLTQDPDYTVNQSFYRTDFTYPATSLPTLTQGFTVNSTDGWSTFKYYLETVCGSGYRVEIYLLGFPGDTGGSLVYTFHNTQNGTWDLVNGYYRLAVYRTGSCTFSSITTTWNEYTLQNTTVSTPYGTVSRNNREVGGIRVKQLKDLDPVSGKTNITSYFYKLYSTDSTLSSGFLNTQVRIMNEFNNDCAGTCQYMMLYANSGYPLANDGGTYVVYPEVRTVESANGWTDRIFSYQPDELPTVNIYPIMPLSTEAARLRGLLLAERTYNQAGSPLLENSYTYGYLKWNSPGTLALKVRLYYKRGGLAHCFESGDASNPNPVSSRARPYYQKGNVFGLLNSSRKVYGVLGDLTTTTVYTYDTTGISRPVIKQVKTGINNGATKEINYRYTFNNVADFAFGLTTPEQTMKSTLLGLNYLEPIEVSNTITQSGGSPTLLEGVKHSFGTWFGNDYHISSLKEYKSSTAFKETIFSEYDTKGNILERYRPGGPREVFLWGYNGTYQVAKILGSNYAIVSAWITNSILNNPANDIALRNHLHTIRTNLSTSPIPAQVTTFCYSPLTGLTMETDAKGVESYYEYDSQHRLKNTKDNYGRILKSFDYNYKQ